MAGLISNKRFAACLVVFQLLVLFVTASAARSVATAAAVKDLDAKARPEEKKEKDCVQEGTVVIPGVGRYAVGSHEEAPDIGGLDHSIPAAVSGHYLPGADDSFVPNPGFEVPNPFHP